MKPFACASLATMTAIALLGSQPEYAFSQSTDSTLAKTATSSPQGFSVNNMDKSVSPDDFYQFAVRSLDTNLLTVLTVTVVVLMLTVILRIGGQQKTLKNLRQKPIN